MIVRKLKKIFIPLPPQDVIFGFVSRWKVLDFCNISKIRKYGLAYFENGWKKLTSQQENIPCGSEFFVKFVYEDVFLRKNGDHKKAGRERYSNSFGFHYLKRVYASPNFFIMTDIYSVWL